MPVFLLFLKGVPTWAWAVLAGAVLVVVIYTAGIYHQKSADALQSERDQVQVITREREGDQAADRARRDDPADRLRQPGRF